MEKENSASVRQGQMTMGELKINSVDPWRDAETLLAVRRAACRNDIPH